MLQGSKETGELSSYIWDVNNPNTPEFELKPFSALTCANYNIKDVNIIGAGQYNGQVCYFDIRKGNAPVESSRVEHSHRSQFSPSKSSTLGCINLSLSLFQDVVPFLKI